MASSKQIGISNLAQVSKDSGGSLGGASMSDVEAYFNQQMIEEKIMDAEVFHEGFPHVSSLNGSVKVEGAGSIEEALEAKKSLITQYASNYKSFNLVLTESGKVKEIIQILNASVSNKVMTFTCRKVMSLKDAMKEADFSGDIAQVVAKAGLDYVKAIERKMKWHSVECPQGAATTDAFMLAAYTEAISMAARPGLIAVFDGDDWYLIDKNGCVVSEPEGELMSVDLG